MSAPAETWFTLAIPDSPPLRMLLADIRDHVRRARLSLRLDAEAHVYAVAEAEVVRLWVNRPALEGLDVFRRLQLQPAEPPGERERVNSLIEHEAVKPLPPPAGTYVSTRPPANAPSR